MSLLTVSSLSKSYGPTDIFSGVSFSVVKGARMAIVGPNGIGKTTLMRILVGVDEATSGTVSRSRGVRIGYLSQEADFEMTGTSGRRANPSSSISKLSRRNCIASKG